MLGEHWDAVHPQLDPEDGNDPTLGQLLLSELCSQKTILKDLRSAPLARSRRWAHQLSARRSRLGELKPIDGAVPKDMAEIKAVFSGDADKLPQR
ncbi:MAG: hypothetical protein U1E35_03260 [Rhodospirillales bacterium]